MQSRGRQSAGRRRDRGADLRPRRELSVAHRRSASHRAAAPSARPTPPRANSGKRSSTASSQEARGVRVAGDQRLLDGNQRPAGTTTVTTGLRPLRDGASSSLRGPLLVTGEHGRHGAGQGGEHAPVGITEIGRHPDREKSHDIDDAPRRSRSRRTPPPASIACATAQRIRPPWRGPATGRAGTAAWAAALSCSATSGVKMRLWP